MIEFKPITDFKPRQIQKLKNVSHMKGLKIMKKVIILMFILFSQNIFGQSAWEKVNSNIDDKLSNIFFVNQDTGFAYGPFESNDKIYRTLNGGKTWDVSNTILHNEFHSIFFTNHKTGWIVGVNADYSNMIFKPVIYQTTDGGDLWQLKLNDDTVTNNLIKVFFINQNIGWILCEDYEINGYDIEKSPKILKTSDSGETWEKYNLNVSSRIIVDFCFVNDSVGFCCYQGIFKTTDSGKTWTKKQDAIYYSDFHCIQFVNDSIGWAGGTIYKTEDAGETWIFQKRYNNYQTDWCFFINEKKGWMGSEYITLDGGENWSIYDSGVGNLWKIFFVNDNVGFAINNNGLYKTTTGGIVTSINDNRRNGVPLNFQLYQNYPNPFNPSTTIKYNLQKSGDVNLIIYNFSGQKIKTLVNEFQTIGEHEIIWQPKGLPNGIYFYRLQADTYSETKRLIFFGQR